ncbi:MAG: tetratricopeptide repeat protein [Hyphomicrobiales bacterium]
MRGQIQFESNSKTTQVIELESLKDEGRRAIKHGNYNHALNCFDLILENDPDNVSILYCKLNVLDKQSERRKAIKILEKLIENDSSNSGLYIRVGDLLSAMRDKGASEAYLTAFNLSDNINPEQFFNDHYSKIRYISTYEQKVDFLNGLLKVKKDSYTINKELISCLFNSKNNNKIAVFKEVLENLTDKAEKINLFSDTISELDNEYTEILRVIELMSEYDFIRATEKEAKLYSDLFMYDKLVEVKERLIKRYPGKLKSLAFELAKACFEAAQYEKALSYFNKAVEYNISDDRLQEYIGRCYIAIGEIERGEDALNIVRMEKLGDKIGINNFHKFGEYSFYSRKYEISVRQYDYLFRDGYSQPENQVNTIEAMIIAGQLDEAKDLLGQRPIKGNFSFKFHVWFLRIVINILQGNTDKDLEGIMEDFRYRYFYRYYLNWSFRRVIEWLHHNECYADEEQKKLLLELNYKLERWKNNIDESNYQRLINYIK